MHRLLRAFGQMVRPLPDVNDYLQIAVSIAFAVGFPLLGATLAGLQGAVIAALGIVSISLFIAVYRSVPDRPLEVIDVKEVQARGGDEQWLVLVVKNPNLRPVTGCYGKVLSFDSQPGARTPDIGYKYPWTSYGGKHRQLATIGPKSQDILDVAMCNAWALRSFFGNATLSGDERVPRAVAFHLPKGLHRLTLEIGSEAGDVESNIVHLLIDFDGFPNLHGRLAPHASNCGCP